jgi:L-seryl-tRNA(Ser) seleniumtransferase
LNNTEKQNLLKQLPGVDHLMGLIKVDDRFKDFPAKLIKESIRNILDLRRQSILSDKSLPDSTPDLSEKALLSDIYLQVFKRDQPNLVNVINATGVVLHTNLGRALLCDDALLNIAVISKSYSNLELNIDTGKRGIRYRAVEDLICELTGAQSAIAVNNNAGAVLLALNTIAQNTEVVVSRGELVEIGGSFRVPDVMSKSGCMLKEVGTTNRTHLRDYENAVSERTGLFLKVHASNYRIQGFTAEVSLTDLVSLGRQKKIPVMEDLGSGTLIDFSKYGLPAEPTIAMSVSSGADVVTFSGDKLLGGPQTGIIVGRKETIDQIKANPLTRALRIDKMTLAALESTLKLYRDEQKAIEQIPTLRMLTMSYDVISKKAEGIQKMIGKALDGVAETDLLDMNSRPGGGSFPELDLPTRCIAIQPKDLSVSSLESKMRLSSPAIIGRIDDNRYILDPRTIQDGQDQTIVSTLTQILVKK